MMKRYYIAYGSNLNIPQMQWRCPEARIIGTGEIRDYALLFKGSKTGSYLTIEKNKGACVPVTVWEVSSEDEKALDRYEGYPRFYYKTDMQIEINGIRTGKTIVRDTFVYIMYEMSDPGIPTEGYYRTCLEGYRAFGFDERFLIDAVRRSKEMMV